MTTFDEREKGFENAFAHKEKLNFDAHARAAKLFGLWAAGQLGLSGQEAQSYALQFVETNLSKTGLEDVLARVEADFEAGKVKIPDHMIKAELGRALRDAQKRNE